MSATPSPPPSPPPLVLVMGVAASGKTTIGRLLADALGVSFVDGDDLHPEANRVRMAQGLPLEDEHRWPWLDAVRARLEAAAGAGQGLVVACSALKRAYRDRLARGLDRLAIVHLHADAATLRERLQRRRGHFFPPSLLDSQLATLEMPHDAIVVDATPPPPAVVASILDRLP